MKEYRTIIHLEVDGVHEYYGSPSALYYKHTAEELGITKAALNNYFSKLSDTYPQQYKNSRCIVRKGKLYVKPSTRGRKNNSSNRL